MAAFDFDKVEIVHNNREQILAELANKRAARGKLAKKYRKPCVWMTSVGISPRTKREPNPQPYFRVFPFNVQGGHKKKESVVNMIRHGNFPIAYDFPDGSEVAAMLKAAAAANGTLTGDMARLLAGQEDPYGELRKYLDVQIKSLLNDWRLADAEIKINSLEEKLQAKEAAKRTKHEELKQELASN